jgi:hypothetical protein
MPSSPLPKKHPLRTKSECITNENRRYRQRQVKKVHRLMNRFINRDFMVLKTICIKLMLNLYANMKITINGILLVLCIGIFANLTSCKRDKSNPQKPVDQLSIEDQKIENLVHAFKTKLSSNLKSGDSISADSVIWYLKMTANSTYGNATAVYDKIATDSSLFTLTIHNGKIPLLDVRVGV